jgi:hypothetical protein
MFIVLTSDDKAVKTGWLGTTGIIASVKRVGTKLEHQFEGTLQSVFVIPVQVLPVTDTIILKELPLQLPEVGIIVYVAVPGLRLLFKSL